MATSSIRVPEIATAGREVDCETFVRDGITYYRQRVNAQLFCRDAETGLLTEVSGVDGAASSIEYTESIALGIVPGHEAFRGCGERNAATVVATGNDLWQGTATTCPIPSQTVGEQMTLVSTSAADSAAGAGIRTVDIHGLDITGAVQREVVTLNGITPVNTVRTDWRFIQSIHSETTGSGGVAAGTVSIYKTGSAVAVYNVIPAGINASLNSARMVPAGKTFFLTNISISAADNSSVSIRLRATSTSEDALTPGHFFLVKDTCVLQNAAREKIFRLPMKFPALSIIKFTAFPKTAGSEVAVSYDGWIE